MLMTSEILNFTDVGPQLVPQTHNVGQMWVPMWAPIWAAQSHCGWPRLLLGHKGRQRGR